MATNTCTSPRCNAALPLDVQFCNLRCRQATLELSRARSAHADAQRRLRAVRALSAFHAQRRSVLAA